MPVHVGIIGAGSWGMAVARLLSRNGHAVTLVEPEGRDFEILVSQRGNPSRLPGFILPDDIVISDNPDHVVRSCEMVCLAIPAQYLRSVLARISEPMHRLGAVVNLAKGIEIRTLHRMSEVIAEMTQAPPSRIVTMSGPSHAEEVILDMPTAVVAAGTHEAVVREVQQVFSGNSFRVYASDDVVGVEVGGSLKNIIAIATGITDGLGMGDNTRGALVTRGLAEMTRLGVAMGAQNATFAGLSGLGDLVTTCSSRHSRNRYVGEQIGRGKKLPEILESMAMVAEGVDTTRSGWELGRQCRVELPITNEVYQVLFDNKSPRSAMADLMGRTLKNEIWQESRG
jgi:glycerol-3-phosphate dehydrogenase (NAD(P)+)